MADDIGMAMHTLKVFVPPQQRDSFIDWQTKLNSQIAAFPGFLSLEILSPATGSSSEDTSGAWTIAERFANVQAHSFWRQSDVCKDLMEELNKMEGKGTPVRVLEFDEEKKQLQGYVTEVFVTQVAPEKEVAYRAWIAKMHQAEAKFIGFRGTYVQAPREGQGHNWITFLQFDKPENLDRWLSSDERKKILSESETLIASLESHRVISPYAGWFASMTQKGEIPPVWKQTMIVLLVLFPIVMLELMYLNIWTAPLNRSLGTFIGNALSVTLISWPGMPIALTFLGWWLAPKGPSKKLMNWMGTGLIALLYLVEIALFWNALS